ncbi:hypothetical protein ACCQ12_00330 [Xanthomonas sp. NCPPB 1068]|uniref:hypothetical protein n=1 Tax=Xanthomonas sp. NCPPB 1068 TaxID=487525 RepID=UPI0035582A12
MNNFRNIIIALITAPELLSGLVVFATYVYQPHLFILAGTHMLDSEVWKYIIVLPTAFTAWSIKTSKEIRAPADKELNKKLYEWPHYPLLVGRIYLALIISILCSATAILTWIFAKKSSPEMIALLYFSSTLISGATAALLTLASQKVPEILTKYG